MVCISQTICEINNASSWRPSLTFGPPLLLVHHNMHLPSASSVLLLPDPNAFCMSFLFTAPQKYSMKLNSQWDFGKKIPDHWSHNVRAEVDKECMKTVYTGKIFLALMHTSGTFVSCQPLLSFTWTWPKSQLYKWPFYSSSSCLQIACTYSWGQAESTAGSKQDFEILLRQNSLIILSQTMWSYPTN